MLFIFTNIDVAFSEYYKGNILFNKFNNKLSYEVFNDEKIKDLGLTIIKYIKLFRELLNLPN